jgi:hypothetical protein
MASPSARMASLSARFSCWIVGLIADQRYSAARVVLSELLRGLAGSEAAADEKVLGGLHQASMVRPSWLVSVTPCRVEEAPVLRAAAVDGNPS